MQLNIEKIKLVLARQEITVTELAERCGATRQRMSCIINAKNIAPKTAGRIAKALSVDVIEIIEMNQIKEKKN